MSKVIVSLTHYCGTENQHEEIYHIISPQLKKVARENIFFGNVEDGGLAAIGSKYFDESWNYKKGKGNEPDEFKISSEKCVYCNNCSELILWNNNYPEYAAIDGKICCSPECTTSYNKKLKDQKDKSNLTNNSPQSGYGKIILNGILIFLAVILVAIVIVIIRKKNKTSKKRS